MTTHPDAEVARRLVEKTAAAIRTELPWQAQEDDGVVTPCVDAEGAPTGEVYVHYGLEAAPAEPPDWERVLQDVVDTWREIGLDIRRRDRDASYSALFVSDGGYNAKVAVNRAEGRVVVGASSPCAPGTSPSSSQL